MFHVRGVLAIKMCVIGFWFFLPPGLDPRPSPKGKEEGEFSRRELQGWMAGQRSCPVGRGITECRSVGAEPAAVVGGEEGATISAHCYCCFIISLVISIFVVLLFSEFHCLIITPSVRKYLSSKWIKRDVSRCILVLDTSLFIHFDDKYFRTEGV